MTNETHTTASGTTIEIISRATADTDYTICYIDGAPCAVVEESDGGYYRKLGEREYITQRCDQYHWYVEDGKWHSVFADRNALVDIMADCTEVEVNDGNQEIYTGKLEHMEEL